jgi:PqqD family protein of HPr-rel-A system
MAASRFVADPPAERIAVEFEGLTILYHRPSGATHVLAPPAPELLDALGAGPADAAGIVARLAEAHDVTGEDALEEIVAARLIELAAAGLVQAA